MLFIVSEFQDDEFRLAAPVEDVDLIHAFEKYLSEAHPTTSRNEWTADNETEVVLAPDNFREIDYFKRIDGVMFKIKVERAYIGTLERTLRKYKKNAFMEFD